MSFANLGVGYCFRGKDRSWLPFWFLFRKELFYFLPVSISLQIPIIKHGVVEELISILRYFHLGIGKFLM